MADTKKRVRRTAEEIAQDFDAKIAYHEKCIESLKDRTEFDSAAAIENIG